MFIGGLKLAVKPVILWSAARLVTEGNICLLVALLLDPSQMHDSRLTFHLMGLLSCRPSLLSSSARITSSLRSWAVLVNAISSTGRSTLASWAAKLRKWSIIINHISKVGCFHCLLFYSSDCNSNSKCGLLIEYQRVNNLTQQVMKNQSIIQILLQTLNHDVLWFQSPIDPINQSLPGHN